MQPLVSQETGALCQSENLEGSAEISRGRTGKLVLGNVDARQDWGFVSDFVTGFWRKFLQAAADDYVLATRKAHSIRNFLDLAFPHVGLR